MSRVAVIGAGKTGRGFVGRLLQESDCEILFIDKNEELVKSLKEQKVFKVSFFGNSRPDFLIHSFDAVTWNEADFSEIDLIFVSVCGQNLEDVGAELKKNLKAKPYYIITCENASHPAKTLCDIIGKEDVFVSEATVFCTTTCQGSLDIHSEDYPYLQCDADLLNGYEPKLKGVKPIHDFGNFLTRKLYTYNAASCVIAYLGYLKGYEDYGAAANDPEILELLDQNYKVTNRVLCQEFGYDEKDQEEFALLSKKKFCDRTIVDTIARNAREPQRKLTAKERVVGPMLLIQKYGGDTSVLEKTAAAMLLYDNENEEEWRRIKSENTKEEILEKIAGISKENPVYERILNMAKKRDL